MAEPHDINTPPAQPASPVSEPLEVQTGSSVLARPIEQAEIFTHPESGEQVEIPAGSVIIHNGDEVDTPFGRVRIVAEGVSEGEILHWQHPPHVAESEVHPDQIVGYEPRFDRGGTARRVLATVSDEIDQTRLGPRNTVSALAFALARDANTPGIKPLSSTEMALRAPGQELDLDGIETAEHQVEQHLGQLVEAGLLEQEGDAYRVTDAGRRELRT